MSDYMAPDLRLVWQSAGEDTITWIVADEEGPSAIIWPRVGTELAITHIRTNYVTEAIEVLLHIGPEEDTLSLWVPLPELIDHMPPEVSSWIIAEAPLTDEERPSDEDSS